MKIIVLILSLCFFPISSFALDIKGLEVDKPVDCDQISALETRTGTFFPACKQGKEMWHHEVSFLSSKARMIFRQAEGILLSVSVSNFQFEEALDALTTKFGQPHIERSTVGNAMGATFEQVVATWTGGATSIRLHKHGSKLNQPWIIMSGAKALERFRQSEAEKTKRNSANI